MLLDTNAIIFLANGAWMEPAGVAAVDAAAGRGEILVSPVSAWEIGLLERRAKNRLTFIPNAQAWFNAFLARPGVRLTPLTVIAAITSSTVPEPFHGDPVDRMLVATARELSVPIVTRDAKIFTYGQAGHIRVIPC